MSLIFRPLFDAASSTWSYLLADAETREAVLIDPVFERHARDAALIRELGLRLLTTLDTHVHADHVTGAWRMAATLGSRIGLSAAAGAEGVDLPLRHGDLVRFGAFTLEVRATPGHTDGCLSFVCHAPRMVFTGDCLLIRGAGRTDFQQGDAARMFRSIHEQIFTLPDDTLIYPAHDYEGRTVSTVAEERAFNARIGGGARIEDFVGYMRNLGLPHPGQIDVAVPANLRCGRPADGLLPTAPTWGPVVTTYAGLPEIDPAWVASHRDAVHVLDVRAAAEWDGELGHVPGSQLIPLDELRARAGEVPRDRPVVVLCQTGRRSGMATVILKKAGLSDVANVAGGLVRWRAEGLG